MTSPDNVLLERYINTARHIEVQILADKHGNVRHLFERDCSLQRNHQKVIEEAPAPNLASDIRARLLESAVRLTEGIGYDSAGTVEYLFDEETGEFYFLEMNTRLQVEHPVTEAISGIDIVEWQLRAAGGEALPFLQNEITCNGWAVEARIAAEDPANDYLPQTGKITVFELAKIAGIRMDSGVQTGSVVGHYYDSMIAKLISHSNDRASAIRRLDRGLKTFHISGLGNNITFLRDLLALPKFINGNHTTATIETCFPDGWTSPAPSSVQNAEAVLGRMLTPVNSPDNTPWSTLGAWRITEVAGRHGAAFYHLEGGGARVEGREGNYTIFLEDCASVKMNNVTLVDDILSYESDGLRHCTRVNIDTDMVTLHGDTGQAIIKVLACDKYFRAGNEADLDGDNQVISPMPGQISEILVKVGDVVNAGDPVAVLEAMKLLQTLASPCDGTINQIHVSTGESAGTGAVLVSIKLNELEE